MVVPKDFIALEPERVRRLKDAALARDPTGKLELDAKRAPARLSDGTAYVMRLELPPKEELLHGTVADLLERILAEVHLEMEVTLGADRIEKLDVRKRTSSSEICTSAVMGDGVNVATVHSCSVFYVLPDRRIESVTAVCVDTPAQRACDPILERRELDTPADALVASEVLGPRRPPVDYSGFTLGQTREDLLAACEAAGLQAVDPKTEPPAIAALLTAGTLASCKGKPKDFAFGPLVQVTAQLDQAKVISFIFDLDAAQADVGKKIDAAYGSQEIREEATGLRYVAPAAKGHELLTVRVAGPTIVDARSALMVMSRVAWERTRQAPRGAPR